MNKRGKQGPEDINETAFRVVSESLGGIKPEDASKDPDAVRLGRKGGLKGGVARSQNLTPEERSVIAKKAAAARWAKKSK